MVFGEAVAEAARRRGVVAEPRFVACMLRVVVLLTMGDSECRCEVKRQSPCSRTPLTILIVPVARLREAWRSEAPMIQQERLPLAYIDCPDPSRLQG